MSIQNSIVVSTAINSAAATAYSNCNFVSNRQPVSTAGFFFIFHLFSPLCFTLFTLLSLILDTLATYKYFIYALLPILMCQASAKVKRRMPGYILSLFLTLPMHVIVLSASSYFFYSQHAHRVSLLALITNRSCVHRIAPRYLLINQLIQSIFIGTFQTCRLFLYINLLLLMFQNRGGCPCPASSDNRLLISRSFRSFIDSRFTQITWHYFF